MSKRDELRRLRNEQKPNKQNETPAEEYSKKAAEALKEDFLSKKTDDSVLQTPHKEETSDLPLRNDSITDKLPQNNNDITESNETNTKKGSADTDDFQTQASVHAPGTSDVPVEASRTAQIRKTKTRVKTMSADEGKRISVSLINENNNWMRRTAMRCGLSIQDYINILLEEAWAREKRSPYVMKDTDPLPERIPSNKTTLVAIKLSEENINHSKRLRAAHCMTMTAYVNYLIQEEMKRESKYGMRASIFDED